MRQMNFLSPLAAFQDDRLGVFPIMKEVGVKVGLLVELIVVQIDQLPARGESLGKSR